jgi:drug/metabolite transporter (DMT)-like permease
MMQTDPTGMLLLFLAVLLRILSNPAANVYQKQLTARGLPPLAINAGTYLLLSVAVLIPAVQTGWPQSSSSFWWYAAGVGVCGAVGNGFLVKALQGGELSVLGPVNSYKSVVSVVFGIFLLGEVPGIWGLTGIMLIIYGSYFVLDTTEERFSARLLRRRDIRFRILAMIFTAVEAVLLKKLILLSGVLVSFIIWCWAGAFFSVLLVLLQPGAGNLGTLRRSDAGKYLLLATCIGIMQYCTNYVFGRMPVGYALSLFQLSMIVTVFFGYHFFKEKDIRKKIIGTVIMIAGSVMIILLA